ncbi:MAG: tetratricopeptide repeat protein [Planctomycetota bacterium]
MATEEEKNALDVSSAELQPDGGPFAGAAAGGDAETDVWALDTHEQLSEHEVFIGDEDFYKLLAESARESAVREPAPGRRLLQAFIRYKHLSSLQKVLIAAIAVVASMLLYALLRPAGQTDAGSPLTSTDETTPTVVQPPIVQPPVPDSPQVAQEEEPALSPTQPLSLEVARSFFVQREYDKARAAYEQLRQALPASDLSLRDFLQLEMALCAKQAGDLEQASRALTVVSQSPSPAVRIVSNYHLSLLEIERKRFLMARTRAYNAIALIKAADFDDDWALSFECDCHFLIAECLSRQVLMLSNADMDLPADLWGSATAASDPFAELQEAELRAILNSGSEHLGTGLLDPKIRRLEYQGDLPQWSVTSYGAPVEELMAKFAASADLDIHWTFNGTPGRNTATDALRQRPVSMHLPAATSHQVLLTAAGCAGLLASPQDNPGGKLKVTISDPIEYASLDEHLSLLSQQAISIWQEFILTFYSDKRIANAHFVMGLLQSQVDLPTEAIAEFKLVANRFSQMSLAPYALLHSSKLKTNVRDYHGVREDLRQLIEQYPDTEIYGQAYLRLADATLEAGLNAEAAQLYQRVYNFGLSAESKTASALGAARSFCETEAYSDAAKWLTQYIHLAGNSGSSTLYSAYYLLGQAYMAMEKYEQACSAFQHALAAQSSREQYVKAITAMVKGHIEQEQLVEALEALENAGAVALSEEQSIEMLLLKCRIFRMMGLVDTATISLRDRAEYVSDVQLNARISFELAQCHLAEGDLERARSRLSEVLSVAEPGALAQNTALELAGVCLKLGRSAQSISVCLQLLDSDVSPQMKQQTLKTLAAAYSQQKDYDKAASALSGQWK